MSHLAKNADERMAAGEQARFNRQLSRMSFTTSLELLCVNVVLLFLIGYMIWFLISFMNMVNTPM